MNTTTAIALKFFALYLLFSMLVSIPSITSMIWMRMPAVDSSLPLWVVPTISLVATVILVILGFALIWKTAESLMKSGDAPAPVNTPMDLDRLLRLALSLIGLLFVLRALVALPHQWSYLQLSSEHQRIFRATPGLVSTAIQLFLGGWLITRPRQWAVWLQKLGNR